jgi:formylmethanofuran dehydrogenase subunit C
MSRLTLKLKSPPDVRINLAGLIPALKAGQTATQIALLPVGGGERPLRLGDVYAISGTAGDVIAIEGSSARVDGVGAGFDGGTLIVEGDVGANAGRGMRRGHFHVRGSAGAYLASGMRGGIVHITHDAGDFVGGVGTGKRFGMTGGNVVIDGNIGARAGDKMRRGLILVRGHTGEAAGARMVGGTIVAEGGFGASAGRLMRRGTLIGPKVDRMLATFADCGLHDLVILKVMARGWAQELGTLAPRPFPAQVRRFAGDLATIGKGELLLTA